MKKGFFSAMKRKPVLIGAGILLLLAVATGMAMKGRGNKTPEVQTA
jgi:nitrate/TMAO reductase-like tetraheme cytochrome c subunit